MPLFQHLPQFLWERCIRRVGLEGIPGLELALHEQHRPPCRTLPTGRERRDIGIVGSFDHGVKPQILKLLPAPLGVAALLLGNLGEDRTVKRVSIVEGQGFHQLTVRQECQGKRLQRIGQGLMKRVIGNRLCHGSIAYPVDARQGIRHKVILGEYPGIYTGNGADVGFIFRDFHHGTASGDGAGVAAVVLVNAAAHDAADIAAAGQGTLGKTGANGSAGQARDAAYIVAVFAADRAIATAVADQSQFHPAADSAYIAALSCNRSQIFAVLRNILQLIAPSLGQVAAGSVVLRIGSRF